MRNAVPLAPPGNIRMLDAIEQRLAQGEPSPGLSTFLRRAGVGVLVVRNDLVRTADVPDPVLVHQALDGSPGLHRVATFGPQVGGEAHLKGKNGGRILVNGGWQNQYPAIEMYEVEGSPRFAVTSEDVPVVVGGPEDLLDLADLGVLGDRPTLLATDVTDAPDPSTRLVLTDGLRAAERHFGRDHDGTSATLVPGDPRRLGNPTRDYLPDGADRWMTTARIDGVKGLSASSSMSDANAYGTIQRGELPYAAVDGHRETTWTASYDPSEPAWWEMTFYAPRQVAAVTVTAGSTDREVVRIRTRDRTTAPVVLSPGASRTVQVDDPAASWVRIEDASGRVGHRLALAEVHVPGLVVDRTLVLPTLPEGWKNPDDIVLRAVSDARTGCAEVDAAVRCVPGREVAPEEPFGFRRRVTIPDSAEYAADLWVRARPGDALDTALQENQPIGVSASTTGNPDPRASALSAVDGDPGTTWTAALGDLRPTIRLNWIGKRRVSGLRLGVAADTAARLPNELTLVWPGGRRDVTVGEDGRARFPAIRTDQLSLRVVEADPATSLDFDSSGSPVPVGISELRLFGVEYLPATLPRDPVRLPCGSGPSVTVNGDVSTTSVTASPADIFAGSKVRAEPCNSRFVHLAGGENQVDVVASDLFVPAALVLSDGVGAGSSPLAVPWTRSGPAHLTLRPQGSGWLLAERANANPGWSATQDEHQLEPVVVDGWAQGWRLADDSTPVTVVFRPDGVYRWGLLAGFLGILALALIAGILGRRWRATAGEPLGSLRAADGLLGAVALVAGGVLAGWVGAALGVSAFVLGSVLTRRIPGSGPWVMAAAVLPAAAAYVLRPWGAAEGWAGGLAWPHYLVVLACGLLFGWLADGSSGRRPRSFRRIPGFSTTK